MPDPSLQISVITSARIEEILQQTIRDLSLNPSQDGVTAEELHRRFWIAFKLILEELVTSQTDVNTVLTALVTAYDTALANLNTVMTTIQNNGYVTTARFNELQASMTTLINGKYTAIYEILSAIQSDYAKGSDLTTLSTRLDNIISGAQTVMKAQKDSAGNVIITHYATKSELSSANSEITKLKSGETTIPTYLKIANIINDLTHTDTNKALSANMGKTLLARIVAIETLLQSDDTSLDELQEIVTYIKNNKTLIDAITSSKVSVSDIINNYNSDVSNKPVSAAVAYALKGLIENIVSGTTTVAHATNADKLGNKNASEYMLAQDFAGGVLAVRGYDSTTGKIKIVKLTEDVDFAYNDETGVLKITVNG